MRPIYSGPNGNTLTGTQHLVWLPLEVSSGPDKGRIVAAEMDPETALVLAQQLIDAAGHAQRAKAAM
jgi:hypothetical protein